MPRRNQRIGFLRIKPPANPVIHMKQYIAQHQRTVRTRRIRKLIERYSGKQLEQMLARAKAEMKDPSRATELVRKISRQEFQGKGLEGKELIEKVLSWMRRDISYVGESISFAQFMYGKLTAEDILSQRKIPTILDLNNRPLFGCGQVCDTLIALLKTFPTIKPESIRHVRIAIPIIGEKGSVTLIPHSVVVFDLPCRTKSGVKHRQFIADPFDEGKVFLGKIYSRRRMLAAADTGRVAIAIWKLKRLGLWQEGNNLLDFNRSYAEYVEEKRNLAAMVRAREKAIITEWRK